MKSNIYISPRNYNLYKIVYAKTDMAAGSKGITAFIIEKGMAGYAFCTFFMYFYYIHE